MSAILTIPSDTSNRIKDRISLIILRNHWSLRPAPHFRFCDSVSASKAYSVHFYSAVWENNSFTFVPNPSGTGRAIHLSEFITISFSGTVRTKGGWFTRADDKNLEMESADWLSGRSSSFYGWRWNSDNTALMKKNIRIVIMQFG